VFECALKCPPALSLIDATQKEFVMAHRLNFANWKIVDLDNYMKGNPYFDKFMTAESFNQSVQRIIGSTDSLQKDVSTLPAINKLKKMMEAASSFEKIKEPQSNIQMPLIYARRFEETKA
jgi:hypothetical protein